MKKINLSPFLSFSLDFIKYFYPQIITLIALIGIFWDNSLGQDLLYGVTDNPQFIAFFALSLVMLSTSVWFSARLYIVRQKLYDKKDIFNNKQEKIIPRFLGSLCFGIISIGIFNYYLKECYNMNLFLLIDLFLLILSIAFIYCCHKRKRITNEIISIGKIFLFFVLSVLIACFYLPNVTGLQHSSFLFPVIFLFIFQGGFYLLLAIRTHSNEPAKENGRGKPLFNKAAEDMFAGNKILTYTFLILLFMSVLIPIISSFHVSIATFFGPCTQFFLIFALILISHSLYRFLKGYIKLGIILLWLMVGILLSFTKEPYLVKTCDVSANSLEKREPIYTHFEEWIDFHHPTFKDSKDCLTLYVVCTYGGGQRAAYWTAKALEELDTHFREKTNKPLSDYLIALSGTSGGNVGSASYVSFLAHNKTIKDSLALSIKNDYLSFTLSRMFIGDILMTRIGKWLSIDDRAGALENSLSHYQKELAKPFDNLYSNKLPMLFINTTRINDSRPGVISNVLIDDTNFPYQIDVLTQIESAYMDTTRPNIRKSLTINTGVIMGARFPFISPPGAIPNLKEKNKFDYYVDGGFFDNAGASTMSDALWSLYKYYENKPNSSWFKRIRICLISLPNATENEVIGTKIPKLSNDLTAPLNTFMGSVGSQANESLTELRQTIAEINRNDWKKAGDYIEIRPTKDKSIIGGDFPLNWYLSDKVYNSIDKDLKKHPNIPKINVTSK